MLQLNFDTFQERFKFEQNTTNKRQPIIHYSEEEERFIFFMKSWEDWEYFSILNKRKIIEFATYTSDRDIALADFKMNYCTHAVRLVHDELIKNPELTEFMQQIDLTKSKDDIIDAGKDIINESEEYKDFFQNVVKGWEKKVLSVLDKAGLSKSLVYEKKSFGEFLSNLFNTVNTVPFLNKIKIFVNGSLKEGVESVEEELSMDIGFSTEHKQLSDRLVTQQLEGYTIDGKKWHGIKGATKDLQTNIYREVQEGIQEGKTLPEVTEKIKEVFKGVKDGQAVRIARTETNRFTSEAKITSYKKSKIVKGKQVSAHIDNRTSDICRRMNGQKVGLDEPFIDPETKIQYYSTPFHPCCRSTIKAVLK